MISQITIKNYKALQNNTLELSNLNIFTGLNGMGKSSLIQVLLLLRQSYLEGGFAKKNKNWILNSELIDLYTYKDILCQNAKPNDVISFDLFMNGIGISWIAVDSSNKERTIIPIKTNITEEMTSNYALFTDNFQYLKADRIVPQLRYNVNEEYVKRKFFGTNGEYSVQYLLENGTKDIALRTLAHPNTQYTNIERQYLLLTQVNSWLGEISPNVDVITTKDDKDETKVVLRYRFYVTAEDGTKIPTAEFKPTHVGFGLTYTLSVLVALLTATPDSILIIENPEAHIHPHGQAKLSELIALAAQSGVQIFIETHSDHIINGTLVACKKYKKTKQGIDYQNVKIYYFDRDESQHIAKVTNVPILDGGRIKFPPKGFFDQIENDLETLMGF